MGTFITRLDRRGRNRSNQGHGGLTTNLRSTSSPSRNIVSDRCLRMDKISLDYAGFRYEYIGGGLRRADLDPDPIKQFQGWFAAAIKAGISVANAVTLATCVDNKPSYRLAVLNDIDERAYV